MSITPEIGTALECPSDASSPEVNQTGPTLLGFLQTAQGNELATRIVGLIENLQRATIETGADQNKRQVEFQHMTWRFWMYLQGVIFVVAIGTAGLLAWHGKLDGAVGTLIGTLVGYVFGKNKG